MEQHRNFELDHKLAEYLELEAAELQVSESAVVALALKLLAHYRSVQREQGSVVLSPFDSTDASLTIHVTDIPSEVKLISPVSLGSLNATLLKVGPASPPPSFPLRLVP